MLTSATLEGHAGFFILVEDCSKNSAPPRSPPSYTPLENPLQGGWEGIQPHILRPHMCLHSYSSPRRSPASQGPPRPPTGPSPGVLNVSSLALSSRPCLKLQGLCLGSTYFHQCRYEDFKEKHYFKCHNTSYLNKNKPTKCGRDSSSSHSNEYENEPTTTYCIAHGNILNILK